MLKRYVIFFLKFRFNLLGPSQLTFFLMVKCWTKMKMTNKTYGTTIEVGT